MIHVRGGAVVVQGQLTLDTVPDLVGAIVKPLSEGVREVDLSEVTDVDSSAVALALEWQRQARQRDLELKWIGAPASLKNLANLYGVAELIPLEQ